MASSIDVDTHINSHNHYDKTYYRNEIAEKMVGLFEGKLLSRVVPLTHSPYLEKLQGCVLGYAPQKVILLASSLELVFGREI